MVEPGQSRHEAVVAGLLDRYPEAERSGFRRRIYRALRDGGMPIHAAREALDDGACRPDAYLVDGRLGNVLIFEVEDTSRLDRRKLTRYLSLGQDLVSAGWTPILVMVSRWGAEAAINLDRLFYDLRQVRASRRCVILPQSV